MRKLIILILLISSTAILYSDPQLDVSKELVLQGSYGSVMSIEVEPISAQTQAYRFGIPFDIQDISVQSSAAQGRPIAHWTFLSNSTTPFSIGINAAKLTYDGESDTDVPLNYELLFTYNVSYFIHGKEQSNSGNFTHSTALNPDGNTYPIIFVNEDGSTIESSSIDLSSLRGSVDGTIYFKFASGQEKTIDDDNTAPPGNYSALVTLTVEVGA